MAAGWSAGTLALMPALPGPGARPRAVLLALGVTFVTATNELAPCTGQGVVDALVD
jgi:hypothetical protein